MNQLYVHDPAQKKSNQLSPILVFASTFVAEPLDDEARTETFSFDYLGRSDYTGFY